MLKLKEKGLPKPVHVRDQHRKCGEGAQVNALLANRRREDAWGVVLGVRLPKMSRTTAHLSVL